MSESATAADDTAGTIEISRHGEVALLRINRERKLNALSSHIEAELMRAFASDEVTTSRVVVITGVARAFSAGADLSELPNPTPAQVMEYYQRTGDMHERFASLPQPTDRRDLGLVSGRRVRAGAGLPTCGSPTWTPPSACPRSRSASSPAPAERCDWCGRWGRPGPRS